MPQTRLATEWNRFLVAVSYFTRLPVDHWARYDSSTLNQASRYFAWMGWVVGIPCALVLWLSAEILPLPVAVLISLAVSLWLTGAFHEDGLADTCDGLGGGWTRDQALSIMKDSRLGTYGAVGLFVVLALKVVALSHFSINGALLALLTAHVVSRYAAMCMIGLLPYARTSDDAKAKPLTNAVDAAAYGIGALALLPLCGMLSGAALTVIALLTGVALWHLRRYFAQRLGGFTGDCLGATQQITELMVYLTLLVAETHRFAYT